MTSQQKGDELTLPEDAVIYSIDTPKPNIIIGKYVVKYPHHIRITYENGYQCLDCETLDIHGVGTNFEEAVKDLENEIGFAYAHYVLGDKKKLSRDAKDYGRILAKNIELRQ